MKFILHKNHFLTSTMGHAIKFVKGEAVHVPPEMWDAAQAIGAVPEEDLPEAKKEDTLEPQDQHKRKEAIFAAMEQLVLGGKRDSFSGTGAPHTKALAQKMGFTIDAKERDVLWQEFGLLEKAE